MKTDKANVYLKRKGTKKQYKEAMQRRRVKNFLNQKLGTRTHSSAMEYVRSREKETLRNGKWQDW